MPVFFYCFKTCKQWRCLEIAAKNNTLVNEQIRAKELRVIAADGEQLGIMSSKEALAIAEEKDLDLVLIAPNAKPPVCKIMNYGKYCFEQAKKAKENKKKQKTMEIKEIRLSLNIDVHDFNTKLKHAERFLKAGNKVKVSIRLRGREMGHSDMGVQTMKRFAEACEEFANVEKQPKLEGRQILMFLVSNQAK
ncbi:MAG: translation initiation factor IF-3 [Ruminococcaceae bacterium]|nr:translation initiation factor IF-3 [Oscillospiraceae bacterium]